ncbi:Subtilisin Carlsberg precursor, putative [Perkinsus marinus ATCC 50983]|uniref:subtilisin n=1 Tax=Perkinsus marinus (strain ATCC 50983 / TXsc) TaxID=423536 RepID=C5KLX8_PERM5|nr:Subtilisin Carlsberg precursor, putative [Perkinsus marinus ATCC 50983]EER14493.1 Subtilisin Carlsberg precursor, putative [Perkinsus marinus ATCC 50983]|eukprot:XP_002782698.1 Subtilisin Carlsberg precursor, putative [Perkinsus marinus ATCC 50983]
MLAQATAASDRVVYPLSVDDLECERCFAQDGAILDLKAVGIQIVESTCSVGHSQILGYLQKAKTMLDIDFDCDPDYEVSISPLFEPTVGTNPECTGGNQVLWTNDPASSCQRNLELIRLGKAWRAASRGHLQDAVLAIIDSGVDMTHPDLVGQFWENPEDGSIGYNFITNTTDVTDDNGHGTHCAGNAAAHTNNRIGIAGVANANFTVPYVKLMILKFLGSNGRGSISNAIRALNYAVEHGANVSSNSYGGTYKTETARVAFENAAAAGHAIFAAAGNSGKNLKSWPSYPCEFAENITGMLCVAASTSDPDRPASLADWSDAGSVTKIAAPGVWIYSTFLAGQYNYMSGTSASTATAAGVGALISSLGEAGGNLTEVLLKSKTAGIPNNFNLTDVGEIDALRAVEISR